MRASAVAVMSAFSLGVARCAGVKTSGDDVFDRPSKGGVSVLASVSFDLRANGSVCVHGPEDWVDFTPVFAPVMDGLSLSSEMLEGFSLNSNGTVRLSLRGFDSAYGHITVGPPMLKWGELNADASIHRCQGGDQEMCYACGRLHGSEDEVTCSHASGCAAHSGFGAADTCPPMFLRVNWDDDDWDWMEDRLGSSPAAGEDELAFYRAVGITRYCWCHTEASDAAHVEGLAASSELRLWRGSSPASSRAGAFEIEAVSATSGIGTGYFSYGIYDATNGLLRTISRSVTAANIELRPDWDDSGTVDDFDRYLFRDEMRPIHWQIRVRETPYVLRLASECPSAMSLTLGLDVSFGTAPVLRASEAGAPAVVQKNMLQDVFVDTSAGECDLTLTFALGETGSETNLTDALSVRIVDTSIRERWVPAGSAAPVVYDYSHVDGEVWWWLYRDTDDGECLVDGGCGSVFALEGLEAGNYRVEVYFGGICEDGQWGYMTSGDLHVVDVRLDRLSETANPANYIFNPARKDDTSGNFVGEKEHAGTPMEERYAAPRNYLYVVGSPDTGAFDVTARFSSVGAETCTNYYCAFYDNDVKIPNSETNVDFATGIVTLSVPGPSEAIEDRLYQLRGGIDLNGNGMLDGDEAAAFTVYTNSERRIKRAYVKGISLAKYNDDLEYIDHRANLIFDDETPPSFVVPKARSLLKIFYLGTHARGLPADLQPNEVNTVILDSMSTNGSCFAEWLTHNAGCDFQPTGVGTICEYVWNEGTEMSDFIAGQSPFALEGFSATPFGGSQIQTETGVKLERFYNQHVRATAEDALRYLEVGSSVTLPLDGGWYAQSGVLSTNVFSSLSPEWVPGVTVNLGVAQSSPAAAIAGELLSPGILGNYEAYIAVGRGRIVDPRYRFDVMKENTATGVVCVVTNVLFKCTVQDLYDFNYEDGGPATKAASLQLGYSSRSSQSNQHGKIFRHAMNISRNYPWPFSRAR